MTGYIYEVNMEGPVQIQQSFQRWLDGHIGKMLEIPLFTEATQVQLGASEGKFQIRVIYGMKSSDALNEYIDDYSEKMRSELPAEYDGQIKYRRFHYSPY